MKARWMAYVLVCALVLSLGGTGAAAAEQPEELSDDIYSFQLSINGELYTFPMSYADFTAMGWEYDGDPGQTLEPNQYTISETFTKDGAEIYGTVINLGINSASFDQCNIGGVSMDPYQFEDAPDTEIVLPGGIRFGEATTEDIQAAYGKPSDMYEGDMYTSMTYEYDSYREWELYVYKESGVLEEFEVRNFVVDEQANAEAAAEVSEEPTEEVLAYVPPEELGEDPMSFTVEYAGDLYQLPAPVSVFLENGWTVKQELSATIISGYDYGWVTLMKDNQEHRCMVRNYGPNAAVVANCFITTVKGDVLGPDLSLTLPGGATVGMTEKELTAWLDGLDGEYVVEESSSFTYYTLEGPNILDEIQFIVNKEEGAVTGIEVTYEPDQLG